MSQATATNGAAGVPAEESGGAMLKTLLENRIGSIRDVSTKYLPAERLVKVFGAQAGRNPKLLKCSKVSLLAAVMLCAELGLVPGPFGEVYLIPYEIWENRKPTGKFECQVQIGYRGLVTLARRSGQILNVMAVLVREGDTFELSYTQEGPQFKHVPAMPPKPGYTGVWALTRLKNGTPQFDYMSFDEVQAIRARSKSKDDGPWISDPGEMAKKTVLRRQCKLLPLTPEVEAVLAIADRLEVDVDTGPTAAPVPQQIRDAIDSLPDPAEPHEPDHEDAHFDADEIASQMPKR